MNDRPHLDEEALAELQDVMDDEFDVLIHTYLNDSAERIAALRSALAAGDADALVRKHAFPQGLALTSSEVIEQYAKSVKEPNTIFVPAGVRLHFCVLSIGLFEV